MSAFDERKYLETRIEHAVLGGVLKDMRSQMPRGEGDWPLRKLSDILGQCTHQNVGNDKDPKATALYHTGKGNHITPGRALPSIVYAIAIPDLPNEPAWLVADPLWRMYSQSASDAKGYPGDENQHLLSVLVMGNFDGPGWKGKERGPSDQQLEAYERVTDWNMKTFGFSEEGLFGHYHFGKAACPGYVLMGRIDGDRDDALDIKTDLQWQEALLRWDTDELPIHGADGVWGNESRRALIRFQQAVGLRVTGQRDPFTELVLLQQYPPPERGDL